MTQFTALVGPMVSANVMSPGLMKHFARSASQRDDSNANSRYLGLYYSGLAEGSAKELTAYCYTITTFILHGLTVLFFFLVADYS